MISDKLLYFLTAIFLFSLSPLSPVQTSFSATHRETTSIISYQKLFSIPTKKGTVGVLLFHEEKGNLYMLLGRENRAGYFAKAGQYCDLGGRLELDGTSIYDNARRELREESAGSFDLTPQHLLSSIVLYKKTASGRDIYYILCLLPKGEFLSQRALYLKRQEAKAQKKPPSYLEKDKFLWVEVKTLLTALQKNVYWVTVKDIHQQTHHIRLRNFFADDCLFHRYFQKSVLQLRTPLKQAH